MLGLTFILSRNPAARREMSESGAVHAAFCAACAGDQRIAVMPLGADVVGNIRCTVHFSDVGLLERFVARLAQALRPEGAMLIGLQAAAPLERAA